MTDREIKLNEQLHKITSQLWFERYKEWKLFKKEIEFKIRDYEANHKYSEALKYCLDKIAVLYKTAYEVDSIHIEKAEYLQIVVKQVELDSVFELNASKK